MTVTRHDWHITELPALRATILLDRTYSAAVSVTQGCREARQPWAMRRNPLGVMNTMHLALQKGRVCRACSHLLCAMLVSLMSISVRSLCAAEPVRLTTDGVLKFSPVFCNGDREIIYADLEKPEQWRLRRLNLATRAVESLHPKAANSEFEPAISADGRVLAFVRTTGTLSVSIVIRTLATDSEATVPPGAGFSGLRAPAVSPDGSRVAFSFADGPQHIYSVDAQGQDRKTLTTGDAVNTEPSYSPDGKSIAFTSTRDGNFEIYAMNSDGPVPD